MNINKELEKAVLKQREKFDNTIDAIYDAIYENYGDYNALDLNDIVVDLVDYFGFTTRTSIDYLIEDLERIKEKY